MKSITYFATEMEEVREGVGLPEREEGAQGRLPTKKEEARVGGGTRAGGKARAMGREEAMGLRRHASNRVRGLGSR